MKKSLTLLYVISALLVSISGIFAQAPNFTDTHGDGSLNGWTSHGTRTWSETGGFMVPQNNTGNTGFLISDFAPTSDGTIEVDLTADQWNGQAGGIVVRWTSPQSYYFITVKPGNQWDSYIKLCKNTTIADSGRTVASRFAMNTSFTLRVELQGATFRFYIDGVLKGEATDASLSSGSFGYAYGAVWNMYTQFSEIRWWNAALTQFPLTVATNGNGTVTPPGGTYAAGTVVDLTATPSEGWSFDNWTGDIQSSSNPLSVTMNAAVNLTANFVQIPMCTLSVVASGNGSVSPQTGSFISGTQVVLTAAPDDGWVFSHWSGDAQGTSNPLTVTMNANKNITAVFEQIPVYSLTTVALGNGSVTPETGSYITGTLITLTATPDAGWRFVNWSGDAQGTTNPLTVTMNANKNITAVFEQIPVYSLTAVVQGNGSVTPETGSYITGTLITLTATPDAGWRFVNWTGDAQGTTNPLTITMNSNVNITANFELIPVYDLSVVTAGSGSVTPENGSFSSGTEVELTATPAQGWVFSHWSGDITGLVNPVIVVMNSSKNITAHFVLITHTLTTDAVGNGTIEPEGGDFPEGTTITLTATPSAGWRFSNWSGDLQGSTNPIELLINANKTVVAHFSQITHALSVTTEGTGSVSPASGTFAEGTSVEITATPEPGWSFDHWSGDLTGSVNPATVVMNSPKTIVAHFVQRLYTLTVTAGENGSVSPLTTTVPEGTLVTVTATPNEGYVFDHWTGDIAGIHNPVQILMDGNKNIAAVFSVYVPLQYTLTTTLIGNGTVSPASGTFNEGAVVGISAIPAAGWIFHHWEGDLAGSQNPAQVTFNANMSIRAVFVFDNQNLSNSRKIAVSAEAFDLDGEPLGNLQPVTVDMTIRLYDAQSQGNVMYTEQFAASNNQGIRIDKGHFTARMGEGLTSDNLVDVLSQNNNLWVEIAIGTDVLSRIPLTSAPYALQYNR